MASAAAAEMAGGGSAPSLDAEALNRRVARRTAAVAAADATSTGAMLLDPDDPDGTDGTGVSGSAASMAADLMRAAEGEAARGIASDPVVASLQTRCARWFWNAAEAEGNCKVSAATSGRVAFQSLPDGRLVVRYAVPRVGAGQSSAVGERTEVVQDLPRGAPPVLRVVALDQSKEARANLAPAAMAVASPRVFWRSCDTEASAERARTRISEAPGARAGRRGIGPPPDDSGEEKTGTILQYVSH